MSRPSVKRQPIPAAQWWRNASEAFKVVAEYLAMAKRAELRDEGHNCGHEFTITAASRGHYTVVGDPTHKDAPERAAGDYVPTMTTKVRAHNLRDALLLAAAEPLAEWVMPDDEDEDPRVSVVMEWYGSTTADHDGIADLLARLDKLEGDR